MSALPDLTGYVEHFRARVVQDALTEATGAYWLRRSEVFEAARHRPGVDYPGAASLDDLRERWVTLTETAQACRARAQMSPLDLDDAVIVAALREVA